MDSGQDLIVVTVENSFPFQRENEDKSTSHRWTAIKARLQTASTCGYNVTKAAIISPRIQ